MYELGDLLKKLRGKLSLREAAKRSGLSYSYISSLENGKHPRTGAPINPTPDILRNLANAYNYGYEELMRVAGYLTNDEKKENPDPNEPEFLKRLDMGDENLLNQYTLMLDGEELTPEQTKIAIAFLRTALSSKKK
ncbi:helix-turn-helix domain-containing protein [Paenibacillus sp. Soil724D2]|uniref:helix-turn-helix domain-containing protein n=1 Tax=Paenibacillus sp. (strain Soil724D2) TaxID=1736392 RepID=UPI00071555EA|nr:helix-turn-helix transcriptional regulator [Paenibacillus sp. Soil724D2]KRE33260.1 hypothetical protein ASG85_13345 [Paenibacillus sp. Soil724D2]